MIEDVLKENNLKVTKQRVLVLNTINDLNNNATIKNILKENYGQLDKSTIYRIIDLLLANNIIDKEINFDNEIIYQLKKNHKHILNCVKCHNRVEVTECPFENEIHNIAGFTILNHSLNIDGICQKCQKKN